MLSRGRLNTNSSMQGNINTTLKHRWTYEEEETLIELFDHAISMNNYTPKDPTPLGREYMGNYKMERNKLLADFDDSVDGHQQGVDRHHLQNRPATIGDFNRADLFYSNRSAIQLPPFARENFAIHPAYYTLVSRGKFRGHPDESPLDHLEVFEDLVSSIKAAGVPADYLLCKLFPHSLAGRGTSWLRQLELGSLTNWTDTKNAFMIHFLDDSVTKLLREKNSSFSQAPTEVTLDDSVLLFSSGINNFKEEEELIPDGVCRSTPTILQEKSCYDKARSTRVNPDNVDRHHLGVDRNQHHIDRPLLTSNRVGLFPDTGVIRHTPSVDRHWTQAPPIFLESPPIAYTPQVTFLLPRQSKKEIPEMLCMGIMDEILLQLPPVDIEKLSPPLQSAMIRDDAPEKQDDKTKTVVVLEQVSDIVPCRIIEKPSTIDGQPYSVETSIDTVIVPDKVLSNNKRPHEASSEFVVENRCAEMVSIDTITCVDRHLTQAKPEFFVRASFQVEFSADTPRTTVTSPTAPLLFAPPPKR
ncbi:Retrotransposon gag domain [Arabidopsis suecica]|uniref:Retrotransposon gag domain n=1 Tax=Arabidopsis suecica TaxID=45249 RepID=A0A8T2G1Q6_ARASU|nr:Retrotransposon gag domain [Arabidopsis suecica]